MRASSLDSRAAARLLLAKPSTCRPGEGEGREEEEDQAAGREVGQRCFERAFVPDPEPCGGGGGASMNFRFYGEELK